MTRHRLLVRATTIGVAAVAVSGAWAAGAATTTSSAPPVKACATSSALLVVPKANGTCPAGSKLVVLGARGPAGAKGKTGATGKAGPAGAKGQTGSAGGTGPQGAAGPAGVAGPAGPPGARGLTGRQGATGPRGHTGATGATGPQGITGPQGTTGATGPKGPAGAVPAAEKWHTVGAAGEPQFTTYSCGTGKTCEWTGTVRFYKDPFGVVHLEGGACWSARYSFAPVGSGACTYDDSGDPEIAAPTVIFTLPAGYRPGVVAETFPTTDRGRSGDPASLSVVYDGTIDESDGENSTVSFDGITFRAAG